MKLSIAALIFAVLFPLSHLSHAADIAPSAQASYSLQQEAMISSYIKQNAWSNGEHATSGIDDLSSITQVGEANYAAITQVGSHNRAEINQSGGNNNVALISQNGNNMAAMIVQRGSNNLAMINQH